MYEGARLRYQILTRNQSGVVENRHHVGIKNNALWGYGDEAASFQMDWERNFANDVLLLIGRKLSPSAPLGHDSTGALGIIHNGILLLPERTGCCRSDRQFYQGKSDEYVVTGAADAVCRQRGRFGHERAYDRTVFMHECRHVIHVWAEHLKSWQPVRP